MHVSAVSEPFSYLPVGMVARRPTLALVPPVRSRRSTASETPRTAGAEESGPKLLLDLNLIAPRPECGRVFAAGDTTTVIPEEQRDPARSPSPEPGPVAGPEGPGGLDLVA